MMRLMPNFYVFHRTDNPDKPITYPDKKVKTLSIGGCVFSIEANAFTDWEIETVYFSSLPDYISPMAFNFDRIKIEVKRSIAIIDTDENGNDYVGTYYEYSTREDFMDLCQRSGIDYYSLNVEFIDEVMTRDDWDSMG